jgi:8-oxo-dGTP pyrophosphatase MutT (NUDIX family)
MGWKAFHIGVKGAIIVDGKMLLLKRENRRGGAFWDVPGGRMEEGEGIEETLRRELREEVPSIGQFEVGELLHAAKVRDERDEIGLMLLYYRVTAEVPTVELSEEHIGHIWAGIGDLPALERGEGGIAMAEFTLAATRRALAGATDE